MSSPTSSGDAAADRGPERFLVRGRLEGLPRRRADRDLVLRWVAHQVLPLEEPVEERWLTEQIAGLARDPVGLRRELVDAGLVTRTRDGSAYWRTHVTEFDVLGQDGMPVESRPGERTDPA